MYVCDASNACMHVLAFVARKLTGVFPANATAQPAEGDVLHLPMYMYGHRSNETSCMRLPNMLTREHTIQYCQVICQGAVAYIQRRRCRQVDGSSVGCGSVVGEGGSGPQRHVRRRGCEHGAAARCRAPFDASLHVSAHVHSSVSVAEHVPANASLFAVCIFI